MSGHISDNVDAGTFGVVDDAAENGNRVVKACVVFCARLVQPRRQKSVVLWGGGGPGAMAASRCSTFHNDRHGLFKAAVQTEERVIVVGGIAILQHLQGHHDGIELQRGGSWGSLCPDDIYLVLKHDVPIAPDLGHRLLNNAQVGHGGCGERQPMHAVGPQPSRNNRGRGDAEIGAFGGRSRWASDRIGRPATSTVRQAKQCLGDDWLFLCVPRRWCTTSHCTAD